LPPLASGRLLKGAGGWKSGSPALRTRPLGAGGFFGGFSPTYGVMIAMRVAEGMAAGIMQPLPNILILRVFEEREQGKAISMFGFGVVLAPALGPSLGGFLVEAFGWRSIFFVVVPLTLIGVLMARRFMAVDSIMMGERQPLDWRGLGLKITP